jgi:PAS domain S-box-containing protein
LTEQAPVRLRGTLTYVDSQLEQCFVQDATGGMRSDNIKDNLELEFGSYVELTGAATEGGSSPSGTFDRVRLIRLEALPRAVRAGTQDLVSGKLQYRFIQIEGRVRSASVDGSGRLVLMLNSEGREVKALVRQDVGGVEYRAYPGAKVGVTGVLAAITDADGAIRELRLLVQSARQITVLEPAKRAEEGGKTRPQLPTLTSAKAVHSLSEDQARMSYPVRFQAVVTYFSPVGRVLTVQDDTDGIYVSVGSAPIPPLRAGQWVEIEGFSGPGDFAPVVSSPRIRVLGERALPTALRMNIQQLLSEPPDSRWVESQGTICSMERANRGVLIGVRAADRRMTLMVALADGLPKRLLYSRARFEGVLAPIFNRKRQLVAVQLRVPAPKYIELEGGAPAGPPPLRSIVQLRQYSPGSGPDPVSRIRGTVTLTHPTGPTYISDATGSVEIGSHAPVSLAIGDVVEATGFAEVSALNPVFEDASLVKVGHVAATKPLLSTITNILEDRWDPRLVAVDGFVVETVTGGPDRRLVLQAKGLLFDARMKEGVLPKLRNGSLVRVAGIVSYDDPGRRPVPQGFTILLRSAGDVRLLRDGPWWTEERTFRLAGLLAAMALTAFAWVTVLRRRVQQRTEDLRGSQQMLQLVLDHIPQRVFWKDREGRFLGCNKAFAEDAGVATPQDAIGKTDYDMEWKDLADRYIADDRKVMETGEAKIGYEEPHIGADGTHRWVRVSKAPLPGSDGEIAGVLGTYEDITESKRAEEKLKQYSAQLAETNEEMKRFTYIVSHDLRAPLVSLKGFASELRYSVDTLRRPVEGLLEHIEEPERSAVVQALQEAVPEALGFVDSSVSRMDHLIAALLRLSRVGYREFRMEELDSGELLQETLRALAHQIESRKITLRIGPLPRITSDRTAMEQVFGNLADNAVKYLDPQRPGQIEVWAEETAESFVFHVRDNGRGIADEDMDKVFAPFRRAGRQDTPGEGMGLAYVRALLHRLGGHIECHSELDAGTTFSFTLPKIQQRGQERSELELAPAR